MVVENGNKAWDLLVKRIDRLEHKVDKMYGLVIATLTSVLVAMIGALIVAFTR